MSASGARQRLRTVLRINAYVSGLTGLAVAVGASTVDRLLDTGAVGIVRAVGVGLVLFAFAVFAVSRSEGGLFEKGSVDITILDLAWVIGSVAAASAGWFSPRGAALVLAVAVVVGTFAALEALSLRQMRSPTRAA